MHNRRTSVIRLIVGVGFSLGLLVTAVHAQSGSLDPPASAVDGVGDPVPTTQTQPSWDQNLPAAERFVLVLPTAATPAGEAVLDKNTGLVWEQSPLTTSHSWSSARFQCLNRRVGDQMGWRLPSIHELLSLLDPTAPPPSSLAFLFCRLVIPLATSRTPNIGRRRRISFLPRAR